MSETHKDKPESLGQPVTRSARDRVTGVDVRIDRVGQGRPVVFLNGLLGMNQQWFPVLGPVAKTHECLLVQPPLLEMKGPGCSVDGVVRLTTSLLETLLDEPAVLVGNSLGGHVATRIALRDPSLVRGLVLVGSSGLFERSFERDVQRTPSREWLIRKIGELFYDRGEIPMFDQLVDMAYDELCDRQAARAFVKLGRSAKRDHVGDELPELCRPVLLAWGREDRVTPPGVALEFHRLLPDARLAWIDRCGHAPQIERPTELGGLIARFLEELAADGVDVQESQEVA